MKEFEEWWDKQHASKYNPGAWYAYEDGWRAAMKCVLNNMCAETWSIVDVEDFIEEELGELK